VSKFARSLANLTPAPMLSFGKQRRLAWALFQQLRSIHPCIYWLESYLKQRFSRLPMSCCLTQ
jgi:hypothetical protein